MQIIENWARIQGVVTAYLQSTAPNGQIIAQIDVRSVQPLEGFPNLFDREVGQIIEVGCPVTSIRSRDLPPVGATVDWRIRRASPSIAFAHPETLRKPD